MFNTVHNLVKKNVCGYNIPFDMHISLTITTQFPCISNIIPIDVQTGTTNVVSSAHYYYFCGV